MANDNTINPTGTSALQNLGNTDASKAASTPQTSTAAKNTEINQQEFLTLLVNQLQHQDPLNPMDSQQFAVQLAQFSQLEQLVQINKKIDGGTGGGSAASMASFLGQEVVLKDQGVHIANGAGPNILLDMPAGTQSARLDLVNADGQVVGSHQIENVEEGKQIIELNNAQVPDGDYEVRAVAVNGTGQFEDLKTKVSGTVEGFALEPDPALIVNGAKVKLEDISEVYYAGQPK